MPLYTILLAMGNPTVHYFSLDIEGAEFPVLKTIPWDKVPMKFVMVSCQNNCDQVDIRVLSVETHLAGRIYPGDRKNLIAYMEKVTKMILLITMTTMMTMTMIQMTMMMMMTMTMMTMTMMMSQVGYRHIHWAHQSTNPSRSEMGTTDDLFVRKDVQLVKEEGGDDAKEALREKLGENDIEELANDVTEQLEHLLDSGKMGLLQKAEREDL